MEDQAPYVRLITAMKEQAIADKSFLQDVQEEFEELNLHNSIYAELLLDLARTLKTFSLDAISDPVAELELDVEHGAGINLYAAIGYLYDYVEGGNPVDLDVALAYIFREKERRILNELS